MRRTSILRKCPQISPVKDSPHTTSSPPARGFNASDASSDDDDSSTLSDFPVDSTAIVMLTLPESPREGFHSPPAGEEHNPPPVTPVSHSSGAGETTAFDDGCTDATLAVDLGNESDGSGETTVLEDTEVIDDSGFSGPGLTQEIESDPDDEYGCGDHVTDLDDGCTDKEILVDVGTKHGDLGVYGMESSHVIEDQLKFEGSDGNEECAKSADQVTDELPQRETEVGKENLPMKKSINEIESDPDDEITDLDDGCTEKEILVDVGVSGMKSSHVIDSGSEDPQKLQASDAGEGYAKSADQVTDELPQRETEVNETMTKLSEDLPTGEANQPMKKSKNDADRQQNSAGGVGFGSVEASNKAMVHLVGMLGNSLGASKAKDRAIKGCLEMLMTVAIEMEKVSEEDDDEDILEIAKKRGMTFPTPRWWPPEGFN